MTSPRAPTPDPADGLLAEPSDREVRVAVLLDRFEEERRRDASIGIGILREEAGDDFDDLVVLAESLHALRTGLGEEDEEVPTSVGRYRILSRIAAGGLGVVYRAADPETGEEVAVKVLRESIALGGKALARFRQEIRAAERLDHPHAVKLRGHGEDAGRLHLVMDLVEGCSLADLIEEIRTTCGPRPDGDWLRVLDARGVPPAARPGRTAAETYARRIAGLFAPVADALAAAARAGLVHRDLKPANLLLRRDGRLLVTDLGSAKIEGHSITSTVAVLGTPLFMSPEQAAGRSHEVDARTDVYGLGATLYSALTLRHPIVGTTFQETLAAIVTRRPEPISSSVPDYPTGLVRVVARCLEKEPRDRYPDAATVAAELRRIEGGGAARHGRLPVVRRVTRHVARHRAAVIAAACVAVIVLGGVAWLVGRPANLEVRSLPRGEIALNGRTVASPFRGEVERGEVEIVVRRDRFRPYRETRRIGAGESVHLDVSLRPEDPFDREALALIAEAHGLPSPASLDPPARMRGGKETPATWAEGLTGLGPRGDVTPAGLVLRLHAHRAIPGARVSIGDPSEASPRATWTLDIPAGTSESTLPEEVRLEPGRELAVRIERPGVDRRSVDWSFRVVEKPDPATGIAASLSDARGEAWERVLSDLARIEAGLACEAYADARTLIAERPDLPRAHHLALRALEALGLADSLPWREHREALGDADAR